MRRTNEVLHEDMKRARDEFNSQGNHLAREINQGSVVAQEYQAEAVDARNLCAIAEQELHLTRRQCAQANQGLRERAAQVISEAQRTASLDSEVLGIKCLDSKHVCPLRPLD